MKDMVLEFLKQRDPKLCIIATASNNGKPESAVMGYAVKDDLTIILNTQKGTRKYNNIKDNSQVSLVFGWGFTEDNVQYDGIARLIEEENQYQETEEFFFGQNPAAKAYKNSNTSFIEIRPLWIRFLDHSVIPSKTTEETF